MLHPELQQAYSSLAGLDRLVAAGDYGEALTRVAAAQAVVARHGLRSASLEHLLAFIAGSIGNHVEALCYVNAALDLDPMNPATQNFRLEVLAHIAETMKSVAPTDRTVFRSYATVVAEDAADTEVHLAYARHLVAVGEPASALAILDALAVLSPNTAMTASVRAAALEATGDKPAAQRTRAEAPAETGFTVPRATA